MPWTKKDKLLFMILMTEGREHLEKQIRDVSRTFISMKQPPPFVIFGYYYPSKQQFIWQNNMNTQSYQFIKNGYMGNFGSDETIKKLCMPVVSLDRKHMNIIPYLLEIVNAAWNVIRIKRNDMYIYALIQKKYMPHVPETFSFERFDNALFLYRQYEKLEMKRK